MKVIGEKTRNVGENAWGATSISYRQMYEIEESDVGKVRYNYRGYTYDSYKFTEADVGRTIMNMTDDEPSWTCWHFHDVPPEIVKEEEDSNLNSKLKNSLPDDWNSYSPNGYNPPEPKD